MSWPGTLTQELHIMAGMLAAGATNPVNRTTYNGGQTTESAAAWRGPEVLCYDAREWLQRLT